MRASEELTKHTLLLYSGDWEKLKAYGQPRELGAGVIVRQIVRQWIKDVEKGIKTKMPQIKLEGEL